MSTNNLILFLVMTVLIIGIAILIYLILRFLRSPFRYPYFVCDFDVSGKRNPYIWDLIDNYIIEGNFFQIQQHYDKIELWKYECIWEINNSKLKKRRKRQFQECLDDENAFEFRMTRNQTRYHQTNYARHPYQVSKVVNRFSCSYSDLMTRVEQLAQINYEMPLRSYHSSNQRKLLTKDLRKQVMLRDNYTCQICGKYMPDEVGLQIDHIIPISKGGKTVLSNLQVTCSKCNGRKKDKMYS